MKKNKKSLFFLYLGCLLIVACSRKSNSFITRNYHAMVSKYNILYNGNIAFDEGLKELSEKHKDNFWQLLSIEPITFEELELEVEIPDFKKGIPMGGGFSENIGGATNEEDTTNKKAGFDKAEEKAVKAVQLHSMNIKGEEKNSQIDDAYLLLGKARYYTQRFVPAIDAFNYVLENYPNAKLINETKIWRAKTNIRLDNDAQAIDSLKSVLKNEELSNHIKEQGHTALALVYVKTDSLQNAIKHLKLATQTNKDKKQTARNLFVLGQLYSNQGDKDSAFAIFKQITALKKIPYKFKIHAELELAKNNNQTNNVEASINHLKKLIKDRDNKAYLDKLYYQIAEIEASRDSVEKAVTFYKKSLSQQTTETYQKTLSYEKLGDISFKNTDFVLAGMYYDSIIQIAKDSKEKRIRRIRRKHKNLTSLIELENRLTFVDSVLNIASMSDADRKTYFTNYIEKLKKDDEIKTQLAANKQLFENENITSGLKKEKGKWYFYNEKTILFGKVAFEKKWGNIPLEDNWRVSEKQQVTTDTSVENLQKINKSSDKYELATYLDALPNETIIDSLKTDRKNVLYQTGVIYKEQFKNLPLSAQRFERLLTLQPDQDMYLPIQYHLYEIYRDLQSEKQEVYKNTIVTQYPNSVFAKTIQNPSSKIVEQNEQEQTEIEATYKEMYQLYSKSEYQLVITKIEEIKENIQNSKFISKFELLKAYCIAKVKGKAAFIEELKYISLNYAKTEQGVKAKEILENLK